MYKNKLYKQIDGVTMGSSLGPTVANFFLGCLEEKLFANNTNNLSPNLYLRYIDDILIVIAHVHSFWIFSIHSIKTLNLPKKKNTNRDNLPFLDVQNKIE